MKIKVKSIVNNLDSKGAAMKKKIIKKIIINIIINYSP